MSEVGRHLGSHSVKQAMSIFKKSPTLPWTELNFRQESQPGAVIGSVVGENRCFDLIF